MSISSHKTEAGRRAGRGEMICESSQAFSLVEILVTVALLSFIILGLVAMFNQTRRAFTSSMTQVDVLESGRSAADLIGREIEQMAATSPAGAQYTFNFYAGLTNAPPMTQGLVDPADFWTNELNYLYFVTRNNHQWSAIGYRLTNYNNGIGTLFRYSSNNISFTNTAALTYMPGNLSGNFLDSALQPGPNFTPIINGVVDFRVRVYDTNGRPFLALTNSTSTIVINTNMYGDYTQEQFSGAALPAYVEVELGVLEDRALAKYQALSVAGTTPGTAAYAYLTSHPGQVHIFRQRIPIRNVNPAAYP